jgi:hypothetical protein
MFFDGQSPPVFLSSPFNHVNSRLMPSHFIIGTCGFCSGPVTATMDNDGIQGAPYCLECHAEVKLEPLGKWGAVMEMKRLRLVKNS